MARPGGKRRAHQSRSQDIPLDPAPLATRLAPALIDLGLCRVLTWTEAAHVLDAVESFDRAREDAIELVARKRHDFYRAIGGSELGLDVFRAKTRHFLATGEEV